MSHAVTPGEDRLVLAVRKLCLKRGTTAILRNISWEVREGEHWVILGSNGSGKTSLLQALTGYLMPTSGEVELLGERFGESDWRTLRERVGLVGSALRQRIPEDETAREVVLSGRRAMIGFWGKPAAEEIARAERFLRRTRSLPLADRPWRVLSQGERQRVLIARALMAEPPLLILDEPCAGLDPVARNRFLAFLQQLMERPRGPSLVLVTHHVEEIVPTFSNALLLKSGRVVAGGSKAKVLTTANLRTTFGPGVKLGSRGGRYRLTVLPKTGGVL